MRKTMMVLALIAALGLALALWALRPRVVGIYLVEGGLGYIVIERNAAGKPVVSEPKWAIEHEHSPGKFYTNVAALIGEVKLEIGITDEAAREQGWDPPRAPAVLTLRASGRASGDFDLVAYRLPDDSLPRIPPAPPATPTPMPLRCPSYLHRVDDARVPEYFKAQRTEGNPERAFNIASQLLETRPGDLHLRALYLEAALKAGDIAEMKKRLEMWRAEFLASENLYLKRIPGLCDYAIEAQTLTDNGRNAEAIMQSLCKLVPTQPTGKRPERTLEEWLAESPKWAACTGAMQIPAELNPARMIGVDHNYLVPQVQAKAMAMIAIFRMIEGRRAEALQLLAAGVSYGRWASEDGALIRRLIGIAIQNIYLGRLEIFALNACETEEELKAVAVALDRLEGSAMAMPISDVEDFIIPPLPFLGGMNFDEASARFSYAVAKRENLRCAVAARRRLLASGSYPATDADFAEFLAGGLPGDPYTLGAAPIKHALVGEDFVAYSIGPDGDDDGAAFAYDPTNGSNSDGDIFLRAPKEREFPFPRGGTKARTPDDLKQIYPKGLPADGFAKTRWLPLGVMAGPPVRIYSFGPDNDENDPLAPPGSPHMPEALYDPTNGITSDGDLFIDLPSN